MKKKQSQLRVTGMARRRIICLCGPVRSGKTVLAHDLAQLHVELGNANAVDILDVDYPYTKLSFLLKRLADEPTRMLIIECREALPPILRKPRVRGSVQFINLERL